MFLQIVIVSCLGFLANAQIDVKSCNSYSAAAGACNQQYSISGGKALTWADVAGFYFLDPSVYCSAANMEKFMKAAECIQKAYIACATEDFSMLVSSADGIGDGVEYFCKNYADFDVSCLSELGACVSNKVPANMTMPAIADGYDKNKEYYCGQGKYYNECIQSNDKLQKCTKSKSKEVIMEIADELNPPACDSTSIVFSSVLLLVSLFVSL